MVTGKPLYSAQEVQEKVAELGSMISKDYADKNLLAVCILRGAFMFFSDLVKNITVPMAVDFVVASSYVRTNSSGEVTIDCGIREGVTDRDILLVEDILDTGATLNYVRESILQMRPRSLKVCVLLDKKDRRVVDVDVDYKGFDIPNEFVVGYGLDYENKFRNLPYISVFKKST